MNFENIRPLFSNSFFSGGIALGAIGGSIAMLRQAPVRFYRHVKRRIMTSVEIEGSSEVYNWVATWLDTHRDDRKFRTSRVLPDYEYKPKWLCEASITKS